MVPEQVGGAEDILVLRNPSIDLFASRGSAQVPVYNTLDRTDRTAAGVNALQQDLRFRLMYAFPPPQPIPLFLGKLKGKSGKVILITNFLVMAAWFSPGICQSRLEFHDLKKR